MVARQQYQTKMTKEELREWEAKEFAMFLRRILFLNQIQMYTAEQFKAMSFIPPNYKSALTNICNAARRCNGLIDNANYSTRDLVKKDLSSDQVHNICLLIDECIDIKNLEDVIEVISRSKQKVPPHADVPAGEQLS